MSSIIIGFERYFRLMTLYPFTMFLVTTMSGMYSIIHIVHPNINIYSSLGRSISFSRDARHRYKKHFGEVNREVSVGGHNFILLDAPGLVEEDYQRHASSQSYDRWTPLPGGPVEFVKSIPAGK